MELAICAKTSATARNTSSNHYDCKRLMRLSAADNQATRQNKIIKSYLQLGSSSNPYAPRLPAQETKSSTKQLPPTDPILGPELISWSSLFFLVGANWLLPGHHFDLTADLRGFEPALVYYPMSRTPPYELSTDAQFSGLSTVDFKTCIETCLRLCFLFLLQRLDSFR